MNPTKIEWCDETWNPVSGCSKVSQGCKNCYAERDFPRPYPGRKFTDVRCHPERLDQPVRKVKGKRIFVNSMSDLFHQDVPFEFIASVFAIMGHTTRHAYLVLTKRPARMLEFFEWALQYEIDGEWFAIPPTHIEAGERIADHWPKSIPWTPHHGHRAGYDNCGPSFPYENVWLGVSVEDQATADERIPLLLQTPAAVRFVSAEPLIGRVDFCEHLGMWWNQTMKCFESVGQKFNPGGLDWVIVGGESGPGARPFNAQWARSIVAQCKAASVPVFVKQLGARPADIVGDPEAFNYGEVLPLSLHDRKGGDWSEWPEDLRVREFPR